MGKWISYHCGVLTELSKINFGPHLHSKAGMLTVLKKIFHAFFEAAFVSDEGKFGSKANWKNSDFEEYVKNLPKAYMCFY